MMIEFHYETGISIQNGIGDKEKPSKTYYCSAMDRTIILQEALISDWM